MTFFTHEEYAMSYDTFDISIGPHNHTFRSPRALEHTNVNCISKMALNIIGATIRNVSVRFRALAAIQKCPTQKIFENVIKSPPISITPVRNLNFMAPGTVNFNFIQIIHANKKKSNHSIVSGEYIWKSTTSSSNAGKKRGRGKGRGRGFTRYTSRFQVIGEGRKQLILPGLNSQVRVGADMLNVKRGNDDPGWYV